MKWIQTTQRLGIPTRRVAGIMVEIYQHQALWNNRQYPRIHQAFSEIWGDEKLWVSFDRGSLNPPERDDYKFPGPHLHWDMSLDMPVRLKVQGVLYLTDTPGNQGAFTCIPGFHHKLEDWLSDLPEEADPRQAIKQKDADAVPVAGKAGGSGYLAQCPATREQPEQRRSPSNCTIYHHVAGTER